MKKHSKATHTLAYFVSPHGFGHAARSAAVMEALGDLIDVRFEIFTTVPSWFFTDSLTARFAYHPLVTDIGMAQKSPLEEDLPETVTALNAFLPFETALIDPLAEQLLRLHCDMVVCDIAPLGIVAAHAAGLPAILVENFTWDWIYNGYAWLNEKIVGHIRYLEGIFGAADFHVQTQPVCQPDDKADLLTGPVSRKTKTTKVSVRHSLDVPSGKKAVLITMGGIEEKCSFVDQLSNQKDYYFVVPGWGGVEERMNSVILLPHHSRYYHPDLVHACDAVLGKIGYSTLAEVYHAGVPFGYVPRAGFPESHMLAAFVEKTMPAMAITETAWRRGDWLDRLEYLFQQGARDAGRPHESPNGADEIAIFLTRLLRVSG